MSFSDETIAEPSRPGAEAHRVLSPGDLVDLKFAADRACLALSELPGAIYEGDFGTAYDLVGSLSSNLHTIIRNLDLENVDDDADADDPQAMNTSRWKEPGHDD